eukprot:3200121-Amphidinium_carterae.1
MALKASAPREDCASQWCPKERLIHNALEDAFYRQRHQKFRFVRISIVLGGMIVQLVGSSKPDFCQTPLLSPKF